MTPRTLTLLAVGLAGLVGLAGCDSVSETAPPDAPATAKLRHWDQAPGGPGSASARAGDADVDFVVTFQTIRVRSYVRDSFCGQTIRVRSYVRDSFEGLAGTVSADSLDQLLDCLVADPDVKFVEPDLPIPTPDEGVEYVALSKDWDGKPGDEYKVDAPKDQLLPWNIDLIKGDDSSAESGDHEGDPVDVDVFIIDTAVDHPEVDVVESLSFLPAGTRAATTTHGNHVAVTIAAFDDKVGLVGVAPGARVHSLEVFDAAGAAPMSRLIEAVDHVAAWKKANPSKPAVVNMSVGAYVGSTAHNALDDAVAALIELGVPVVVSAGNHAVNASLVSPAHVASAITVGAYAGDKKFSSRFSNYGSVLDLLAPGDYVVSGASEGRYAMMSGTSMAAPHVTGAAALYLARHPSASAAEVAKEVVKAGKDEIKDVARGTTKRSVWLEKL